MTVFTPQERRVVLFLIVSLLVGSGVKLYRSRRASELHPATAGILFSSTHDSTEVQTLDTLIAEVQRMIAGDYPARMPLVDLNAASELELRLLPGIGPKLARRIVSYRRTHGKYKLVRDLVEVPGIGEKKLAAIEGMVFVGARDTSDEDVGEVLEPGANRP
jgi:competence ComEA-like helix-hairpin-helix protein